jgi:anthranilate phosphoribosyltransferase
VLRELGVLPATTRGVAARNFAEKGVALVPTALLAPGLAGVLAMRNQLGISTPAQRVANVLTSIVEEPASAAHVLEVPSWLQAVVTGESCFLRNPAILSVCSGREASGHPALTILQADLQRGSWTTLFETEGRAKMPGISSSAGTHSPDAPAAWDTKAWAAWTRRVLDGKTALPATVLHMLTACLVGCGYARDINEAKAVAAVGGLGGSGLAAA